MGGGKDTASLNKNIAYKEHNNQNKKHTLYSFW